MIHCQAALVRLLASKKDYNRNPDKRTRQKWCESCRILQLLSQHPDIDMDLGITVSQLIHVTSTDLFVAETSLETKEGKAHDTVRVLLVQFRYINE